MKEKSLILILCTIIALLGIVPSVYFYNHYTEFNFYKSEITLNGNQVTERLYYSPDKNYHTLFRNFVDPLYLYSSTGNSITIKDVKCSDGTAYAYTKEGFATFNEAVQTKSAPISYTEENEYGCTFGAQYGFFQGGNYWIEASYTVNAKNIFQIKGKNYIKFVVYSPGKHTSLTKDNFIVNGEAVKSDSYAMRDNVLLYLPYENTEGKTIVKLRNFQYDNSSWKSILAILIGLIPAVIIYLLWLKFGREELEPDLPKELSDYPQKRKGWEVAAFFNPPFKTINRNFVSALILDLYNRKIIDVRTEKGFFIEKCFIKILKKDSSLDKIESRFVEMIELMGSSGKTSDGFIDISKANSFGLRWSVQAKYTTIETALQVIGKDYLDSTGTVVIILSMIPLLFIAFAMQQFGLVISAFAAIFLSTILSSQSSLFTKYNGNYYEEYKKWQAFKKHLNNASSLKMHKSQGVKVWSEYLVYAAAFGIAEKVLKELQSQGLITHQQAAIYTGAVHTSTGFASATGHSSSGGHGGAGGGGSGGGGGGGR